MYLNEYIQTVLFPDCVGRLRTNMSLQRRAVLRAGMVASTTLISGCFGVVEYPLLGGERKRYDAGTLVVENTHTIDHEVEILAKRTEEGERKVAYKNTFRLKPSEKEAVKDFLNTSGVYTITVTLDGMEVDKFKYSPGGEVETYLHILIPESERIKWVSRTV